MCGVCVATQHTEAQHTVVEHPHPSALDQTIAKPQRSGTPPLLAANPPGQSRQKATQCRMP